jgi:hypothetical protein
VATRKIRFSQVYWPAQIIPNPLFFNKLLKIVNLGSDFLALFCFEC